MERQAMRKCDLESRQSNDFLTFDDVYNEIDRMARDPGQHHLLEDNPNEHQDFRARRLLKDASRGVNRYEQDASTTANSQDDENMEVASTTANSQDMEVAEDMEVASTTPSGAIQDDETSSNLIASLPAGFGSDFDMLQYAWSC